MKGLEYFNSLPIEAKSLIASTLTGTFSQLLTFIILYFTNNFKLALVSYQFLGTIITYYFQTLVFNYSSFFNIVLLKWLVVLTLTLLLNRKLEVYLSGLPFIRKLKDKYENSEKKIKRTLFNFIYLIVIVLTVYFIWDLPMRVSYIFNDKTELNPIAFIILGSVSFFVYQDQVSKN